MIRVTKLDGTPIILNADWIQIIEETPDTLIILATGFRLLVKEKVDEVMEAFWEYKGQSSQPVIKKKVAA